MAVPMDSTATKPKPRKLANDINFNPLDYQLQDRYIAKGDTFRHRFLDHLSLGFVTGVAQVAPKGGRSMDWGIPVGGMVGYEFNRLHGIRGSFFHTNYEMNDESGTVKQWEVDVDYMFNLTNYLYGYNRRRMFHVSPTVGLGYVHSTYQNERASIFKGQLGVNVGVGLGRNARFFVEPFVAGLSDEADHSADENVSKFDIQYGVKAGLAVNLDVGTMIANGERPSDYANEMRYVSHVHISEPGLAPIERRGLHRELALTLGAVGWKGWVSLEMKAGDPDALRRSLEYVAEVFP